MAKRISRRDLLKTAAATGASYAAADRIPRLPAVAVAAPSAPNPSADRILALTTTNDVFVPPKAGGFIEWSATAEMLQPIKSVAAIVRGVPRGKISAGGGSFFDPGDSEILLGYPFGGGSLFTARGMNSPIAVIQGGGEDFFFLSCLNHQVRANRFYFQPGEKDYRVELVYECAGWQKSQRLVTPLWRAGRVPTADGAFRPPLAP